MKFIKNNKRKDKSTYLIEYVYNKLFVSWMVPLLSKTKITPNMITVFNIILSFITFYLAYYNKYKSVAILILIYAINDELDGNLARYTEKFSELGAKLDNLSDFIFYNGIYVFIGKDNINGILIILLIIIINIYGFTATYYIVPKLKKLQYIKRFPIKGWFLNKKIIVGMDICTMGVITSICLVLNKIKELYVIIIILHIVDLIYRLVELKFNEKINYI